MTLQNWTVTMLLQNGNVSLFQNWNATTEFEHGPAERKGYNVTAEWKYCVNKNLTVTAEFEYFVISELKCYNVTG